MDPADDVPAGSDRATRHTVGLRVRNGILLVVVGLPVTVVVMATSPSNSNDPVVGFLFAFGLIAAVGGVGGLGRTLVWNRRLRRHHWQRVKVRAGAARIGHRRSREVFLLPDFAGGTPYGLAATFLATASAVHHSGSMLVAGIPGHSLIAAPLDRSKLVKLRPPRTAATKRRWSAAFER